jgi:hypothetical protein
MLAVLILLLEVVRISQAELREDVVAGSLLGIRSAGRRAWAKETERLLRCERLHWRRLGLGRRLKRV